MAYIDEKVLGPICEREKHLEWMAECCVCVANGGAFGKRSRGQVTLYDRMGTGAVANFGNRAEVASRRL